MLLDKRGLCFIVTRTWLSSLDNNFLRHYKKGNRLVFYAKNRLVFYAP